MAKSVPPLPPKGTAAGGAKLWRAVMSEFELSAAEEALLVELTRVVDRLDGLNAVIAKDGVTVGNRPHPALAEARQTEVVMAKLAAVLRFPDAESGRRPQRRAIRGVYGVAGAGAGA